MFVIIAVQDYDYRYLKKRNVIVGPWLLKINVQFDCFVGSVVLLTLLFLQLFVLEIGIFRY